MVNVCASKHKAVRNVLYLNIKTKNDIVCVWRQLFTKWNYFKQRLDIRENITWEIDGVRTLTRGVSYWGGLYYSCLNSREMKSSVSYLRSDTSVDDGVKTLLFLHLHFECVTCNCQLASLHIMYVYTVFR